MYQYKAILKSTKETVAEDHNIEGIEHKVLHYRRQVKKGNHTHNDPIEIFHQFRNGRKDKLVKIV